MSYYVDRHQQTIGGWRTYASIPGFADALACAELP